MPAPGHRRGSHHTAPLPSHRPLGAGSRGALRPEGLSLLVVLSATPPSGAGPAEGRNVGARLRARAGRRKDGAMHHAEVSRAAAGAGRRRGVLLALCERASARRPRAQLGPRAQRTGAERPRGGGPPGGRPWPPGV